MPEGYEPPFPAYCARFPQSVKDVVMAIIGAQHSTVTKAKDSKALSQILSFMKGTQSSPPQRWDLASVTDAEGAYNEVVIAYWDNIPAFKDWKEGSGFQPWWDSLDPQAENNGWFQEVFLPSIDRFETIYSDLMEGRDAEGAGHMRCGMSGLVREHVYWGSMRDRLAASQTDELVGNAQPSTNGPQDTTKARIRLPGKQNLAVIRSGQDWSRTSPDERKLYLDTMHPVLIEGMNFLRDKGGEIGCYSCRFMDVLEPTSMMTGTEQTFGLAYFDDLASLEKWSKEHQTHLNIFGGFLQYAKKLNFDVTLHLYHEVLVLKPEQQYFEYIGCHPKTGMMGGLKDTS
jgi:Haem-containing dehydratase